MAKIRIKCKIAPGGKCITGPGLRYTLTGKDRQKYGGPDKVGNIHFISFDLDHRGKVKSSTGKVVRRTLK